MESTLAGRVAFITGAARGQGREHARRLAAAGAGIVAVDVCDDVAATNYPLATKADLDETVEMVRSAGGRISAHVADVRDAAALREAHAAGERELGPIDIVIANAGVACMIGDQIHRFSQRSDEQVLEWYRSRPLVDPKWEDTLAINCTGVMNTIEAAIPSMIAGGKGGSIVVTGSTASAKGVGGPTVGGLAYTASKHAVTGLMRAYSNNLAQHWIRVNAVAPTGVSTPMIVNEAWDRHMEGNEDFSDRALTNALPVPMVEVEDVSAAVLYLVSDAARYVTGIELPVDAGFRNAC